MLFGKGVCKHMGYGRFEKLRKLLFQRFRYTLGWGGKRASLLLSTRRFYAFAIEGLRTALVPAGVPSRSTACKPANRYSKRVSLALERKDRQKREFVGSRRGGACSSRPTQSYAIPTRQARACPRKEQRYSKRMFHHNP